MIAFTRIVEFGLLPVMAAELVKSSSRHQARCGTPVAIALGEVGTRKIIPKRRARLLRPPRCRYIKNYLRVEISLSGFPFDVVWTVAVDDERG
jgi:hypothetical protein